MAGDTTKLTIELELILRRLQQTLRGLDQVERRLQRIANIRVNATQAQSAQRAAIASQRLAQAQQRLQLQQQRLTIATQQTATAQGRAALAAQRLTLAQQRLVAGQQRLTSSLASSSRILPVVQQRLNSLGAAALRIGGGLRSVGASASILISGPLAALGVLASRSAADIDAIRNRLIATEGSLEAANARLTQLRKLADESVGVTRRTALDTFAILATLGRVTEETINKQIKSFGRLNAAFTIDDQQLFFRNLLQIFDQAFETKDIKEALGRVPIFNQLLEQAFGTADPDKLRELRASGKLTLDTFLAGLATAVETDPVLGQISESVRVRFQKTIERITDSLEPLGRAILGPLERIVLTLEPIILRVAQAFDKLPPGIQTAIVAVGLLTVALGPILFILGGIASGIGAFATAAAALLPILGSIGLPAIAALLAGIAIVIGEITAVVVALGLAWRSNFLNIRGLVTNAANAVIGAFNRIRGVFDDAIRRILPTLQSITMKVLNAVTEAWNRYGSTIVKVVGDAFRFITDVTVVFLRLFTDFVDLVLKLIDGDWRGAWRAFARIIITQLDNIGPLLVRLGRTVNRALLTITAFIIRQAIVFAEAGSRLAASLITSLASGIVNGAPQIANALSIMLLTAAARVTLGPIAQSLVARLLAGIRRAASEGLPALAETGLPGSQEDVAGAGVFRKKRRGLPTIAATATDDSKGKRAISNQLAKLREAQDKLDEQREQNRLREINSTIQQQFELAKDGLDREQRALEDSFEDRLKSVRAYFAERERLETAQVDAELAKEKGLSRLLADEFFARRKQIQGEFDTAVAEISSDQRLKGRAKQLALETAEINRQTEETKAFGEFESQNAEVATRILVLQKQRADIVARNTREQRLLNEEIAKQQVQIRADLLDEQGRTADAEGLRLKARFTETIRDLRIDTVGLGVELQDALSRVDLSVLQSRLDELPEPVRLLIELLDIGIKRAQIAEQAQLVDTLSVELRTREEAIQNRVLDGLISQRQAQAEIVVLQQKYRALLLDILKGEKAKAEEIGDQAVIASIEAQIQATERLGVAIDEAGQRINQALFSDLQSGLSGIFSGARRGFEGLRDAAISFGERLLDTLNDIAATSILERIQGLFKPDATNTQGTVGGFISKLFGMQPKQATDAATASATLQAGATTAAATITTGATAAGTTFGTSVITAATSFASLIISAGAAFAAAVGIGGATQAAGGSLGSLLGGAAGAATGLFPAVPGGVYNVLEGGYPEAVMTTDPRYYSRQMEILRAYLKETRGLGGRIKSFALGGMVSPSVAMMSGMSAPVMPSGDVGSMVVAGAPSEMRLRQVLVSENQLPNWVNSSEGEQVLVDWLYKHQPIIRKIGGGR